MTCETCKTGAARPLSPSENVYFLPPVSARAMDERDRRLRTSLVYALENTTDGRAMGCVLGALASLVESEEDATALKMAQAGILALVGRFQT